MNTDKFIGGQWWSAETSIRSHKEPYLRKSEATTRFLGDFFGLEKDMRGLMLEI